LLLLSIHILASIFQFAIAILLRGDFRELDFVGKKDLAIFFISLGPILDFCSSFGIYPS